MVIMNYNDASVHPDIRRINARELSLVKRGEKGSECDSIFIGYLDGQKVVLKARHQKAKVEFPGFLRVEANSLYTLQGVVCVPRMYGFVEDEVVTLRTPGVDEQFQITAGIVTEYAKGRPIMTVSKYVNSGTAQRYHQETGINIHGAVGEQLAQYLRGSMERRLVDTDLPERDIFLDINSLEVKVTKIDQGHVKNRRDSDAGITFEVYDHKYDNVMKWLLALPMVDLDRYSRENLVLPSSNEDMYREEAGRYRARGLVALPDLMEAYARREFDTNTFQRRFPDDITFLQFLDRWEKTMTEFGMYFVDAKEK